MVWHISHCDILKFVRFYLILLLIWFISQMENKMRMAYNCAILPNKQLQFVPIILYERLEYGNIFTSFPLLKSRFLSQICLILPNVMASVCTLFFLNTHISIFRLFSHIGYYIILDRVPSAIQQVPIDHPFHIHQCA